MGNLHSLAPSCNMSSSLAAFKTFSLSFVLSNLIMIYRRVVLFMFLLLGVCWDYSFCGFIIFITFRPFWSWFFQVFFLFRSFSLFLKFPHKTPITKLFWWLQLCNIIWNPELWCLQFFLFLNCFGYLGSFVVQYKF